MDIRIGLVEVWRIGNIVGFGTELQLCLLKEWKVAEDRKIDALLVRSGQDILPGVPRCAKSLRDK